jgi:predicted transcriptional regulator
MNERREMGALEAEVLSELWAFGAPATPAEVLDALDTDLAYTTVMTILTRLWQKGLVKRQRQGRAYAYAPVMSEAEFTARRMRAVLAAASDRDAALSRFVGALSAREVKAVRALFNDPRLRRRS